MNVDKLIIRRILYYLFQFSQMRSGASFRKYNSRLWHAGRVMPINVLELYLYLLVINFR
jgi:hypothetical protein